MGQQEILPQKGARVLDRLAKINHACKVVRPGRSFLHRMNDLLHAIHHPHNSTTPIRLNNGFRSDLSWCHQFVQQWNGVSFLSPPSHLPSLEMTSDASGSWGCGVWHNNSWFQLCWDERAHPLSIAEKELIPIILGCATWVNTWRACQVACHCDNQAIVACLRSRTSKQKGIMHLLCCLVYTLKLYTLFTSHRCILTLSPLSWQMIYPATTYPLFFQRLLAQIDIRHQCQAPYWTSYWIPRWNGPLQPGALDSAIFSGGSSPGNSQNLPRRRETF